MAAAVVDGAATDEDATDTVAAVSRGTIAACSGTLNQDRNHWSDRTCGQVFRVDATKHVTPD